MLKRYAKDPWPAGDLCFLFFSNASKPAECCSSTLYPRLFSGTCHGFILSHSEWLPKTQIYWPAAHHCLYSMLCGGVVTKKKCPRGVCFSVALCWQPILNMWMPNEMHVSALALIHCDGMYCCEGVGNQTCGKLSPSS